MGAEGFALMARKSSRMNGEVSRAFVFSANSSLRASIEVLLRHNNPSYRRCVESYEEEERRS